MIFDLTKSYVPESYRDSRDYRVLLRQLGVVLTVNKYSIDKFPDLYSADRCPAHMLPHLASMVGYHYNYDKSVTSNRKIIKTFPQMLRSRGSEVGVRLAVALSIHTSPGSQRSYSINDILVEPDVENGLIKIYYPNVEVLDWSLLTYVRPVGMRIKLIRSDMAISTEELDLKVSARTIRRDDHFDESVIREHPQVSFDSTEITRDTEE